MTAGASWVALAAAGVLLAQEADPDRRIAASCVEIEHTVPEPSVRAALSNIREICRDIGPLHPGRWILSDYRAMPNDGPYRAWNCASQRMELDPPAMGGVRNEISYSAAGPAETAQRVTLYVRVANANAKARVSAIAVRVGTEAARRVHVSLTAEETAFLRDLPAQGGPKARTERGVHIDMSYFNRGEYVVRFTAPYVAMAC